MKGSCEQPVCQDFCTVYFALGQAEQALRKVKNNEHKGKGKIPKNYINTVI